MNEKLKSVNSLVSLMKGKTLLIPILTSLFLVFSTTQSTTLDYYVVVEENGNSVVIITIHGSGLVNIPIQEDVEEIKVKGGLYMFDNNSVDISIGSTEKAVLLYKTSLLTEKQGNTWNFNMSLTELEKNEIIVAMPNTTIVKNMIPPAFIESMDFTKLMWTENPKNIFVEYCFENELDETLNLDKVEQKPEQFDYRVISVLTILGILCGSIVVYTRKRKTSRMKNKQNIMRTLPVNEKKIVSMLIENKGGMKRSRLERETGIAKSSLASALKNLEKKNIVELDKTYKTHYVKLTKWFDEL